MIDQWLMLGAAMLVTGCVAGILAGLFGIGGGVVIVPVLYFALELLGVDAAIRMHVAVATSLATIIPTSLSSARAHHLRGAVDMTVVRGWAGFVLIGSLLGVWTAARLQSHTLLIVFAVLALAVGVKMIAFPTSRAIARELPAAWQAAPIAAAIGYLSSMMGIGGGTFSVMTLTLFNQPIHRAVGTASLIGLLISLPGTLAFIVAGWNDARLPTGNFGYVSIPGLLLIASATVLTAPIGARIAHGYSAKKLNLLFGAFLLLAAIRMLYKGYA